MSDLFVELATNNAVRLSDARRDDYLTAAVRAMEDGCAVGYGFMDRFGVEHAVIGLTAPSGAVWGAYDFRVAGV